MFSSVVPRFRFQVVVNKSSLFFHKIFLINKYTETFEIYIRIKLLKINNRKSIVIK